MLATESACSTCAMTTVSSAQRARCSASPIDSCLAARVLSAPLADRRGVRELHSGSRVTAGVDVRENDAGRARIQRAQDVYRCVFTDAYEDRQANAVSGSKMVLHLVTIGQPVLCVDHDEVEA